MLNQSQEESRSKKGVVIVVTMGIVAAVATFWIQSRPIHEPKETKSATPPARELRMPGAADFDSSAERPNDSVGPVEGIGADFVPPKLPPPRFKSRPPGEWDGMLVDSERQAECDTTSRCSLARACIAGRCGACAQDSDCLGEEACVLDHCVRRSKTMCRTRADCPSNWLCALSDYSNDVRGNHDMRAYCLDPAGGEQQVEAADAHPQQDYGPRRDGPVSVDKLRASLPD